MRSDSSLRIVVSGLAATYPLGGVFWDYIQYLLGLQRLGHDVLYIEDTERWFYDPQRGTYIECGEQNAARFGSFINEFASTLSDRWYVRDAQGSSFGRSWSSVVEFCQSADIFLNISASASPREEYFTAKVAALIDTDPLYTQAWAHEVPDLLSPYQTLFSFGANLGTTYSNIPTNEQWIPTRQPVVLDLFRQNILSPAHRRQVLTTVASWEPSERGPCVNDVQYYGKSVEFERFMELPRWSSLPLELALSGPAPRDRLKAHGWTLRDPLTVSCDPGVYRSYLASSFAEWSIAKHAYVATSSGWFSCRSASYLALGVPVIVQSTCIEHLYPTGKGILAFETLEEAVAAIEEVKGAPELHARAAIELAATFFNSDDVLTHLLESIFRDDTVA